MQGAERERMNVFEKIKEKLEEKKQEAHALRGKPHMGYDTLCGWISAIDYAVEIIDQVAEEMTCLSECSQCEVYDKEKHHCPRFCKVIKDSVEEIKENHYEEIRNKAIDEFLQEIDKAIIDRKARSLKPNSVILDHVNDFDEVKRETLHKIAEQLKLSGNSEQLNGWIPVEECLPEENQEVQLTFENSAGVHVGEATYKNNMFFYVTDTQFGYYEEVYKCPVAWKPKDKPYQKGA